MALSASEAVYGVLAWLSAQPQSIQIGAGCDCGMLASAANAFCVANSLPEPRDNWAADLKHPTQEVK